MIRRRCIYLVRPCYFKAVLASIVLFGCSSPSSDKEPDQRSGGGQEVASPPLAPSGKSEQPPKKTVSEQVKLTPSPFYMQLAQPKKILAILDQCVKKDNCTVRWGSPSWEGFQNDDRADPREFRAGLVRKPFRFRTADGRELACEPEDAARILTAFKARVEDLVRQSGGRLGETREERGLEVLDINGKILHELKGRLRGVRICYAHASAQGEVHARIDLQEGAYIGPNPLDPFTGRSGVLAVRLVETVSRPRTAGPDKRTAK